MSSVYDEALLDAKKIREVAETAARDRVMETITPQIRAMINNRILSEQDDEDDWELDDADDLDDVGTEFDAGAEDLDLDSIVDSMPDVDTAYGDDVVDAAVLDAAAVVVNAAGDVNVFAGDQPDSGGSMMMGESPASIFAQLVNKDFTTAKSLARKITVLRERVKKLKSVMGIVKESKLTSNQKKRLELSFVSCVKDAVSLQSEMKASGRGTQRLEEKLNSTIKEMREMSSKYKKNIFDFLFEAGDAESKKGKVRRMMREQDEVMDDEVMDDMGDEELELDVEEGSGDVDVDAASSAIQDLGDALGLDLEIVDEEGGEEDLDVELEDEDLEDAGEEDLDVELEETFGGMYEADKGDLDKDVYEIDESVLRQELARMRRARKVRESRKPRCQPANRRGIRRAVREAAEDEADQFGGAEILGDVIEVDEDTLINVLADELGSVSENRRSRQRRRAPGRRPSAQTGVAKRAIREAAAYKKAANQLKGQLVEMNLFNAKLLYANKLLQNKGLSVKQQRAIVEALDNAKTLREAKLLYKSLSGSLTRRGRGGKNLSEGNSRTLGSSSRSTQSGQPAKSGVETDRWAVLAGINKG